MAAILGGAAQVLVKHGYDRANTGLIAEAAGVSIGSVYQYFPYKEAVFGALIERELEELGESAMASLMENSNAPAEQKVFALVRALCASKARNPKLNRVLKTELGRLDGARIVRAATERYLGMTTDFLLAHRTELRVSDPERSAFFVVNALEGILGAAAQDGTSTLTDPKFVDELATVVLAMLGPRDKLERWSRR